MKIVTDGPIRPARRQRSHRKVEPAAAIAAVRRSGDAALVRLGGIGPDDLVIPRQEQKRAFARLEPRVRAALEVACRHTGALSRRLLAARKTFDLHPSAGLSIYHRHVPLGAVGLLVPEGRVAPLLSGAIAAAVAGVPERVVCTAAGPKGRPPDPVLAAAFMCDVTTLCVAGGPAAVAAMAMGTQSVPRVERILGIGGPDALEAGRLLESGCDVRLAAPGDLLVLADRTAPKDFVAADLLAHAEAAPEADALLVTPSRELAEEVVAAARRLARGVPTSGPMRRALRRQRAWIARDREDALALANAYAPATASLMVERPAEWVAGLHTAGTVLLGAHTPATLGEYATGVSVLLPAQGQARTSSPVTVQSLARGVDSALVDSSAYGRLARVGTALAEQEGRVFAQLALRVRQAPP